MFLGTVKRQTIPDRHRDLFIIPGCKNARGRNWNRNSSTERKGSAGRPKWDFPSDFCCVQDAGCSSLMSLPLLALRQVTPVFSVDGVCTWRHSLPFVCCFSLPASFCLLLTYAYDTLDKLTHLKLEGQLSVSFLQTVHHKCKYPWVTANDKADGLSVGRIEHSRDNIQSVAYDVK